jgi:carboxypeptidase family protein/TonB-dependent receptor-like protein
MKRITGLVLAFALALVPGAWAQFTGGNIYGVVTDASGAMLPGANVAMTSDRSGERSTTSSTQGDFRFLNLDPGTYKLAITLKGFATVKRDVIVTTGQNVNVSFSMKVASVEETVTVTAETPAVDTKKVGTSTTLTNEELSQTPQSRDPWAVLKTVPGVLVDRVSIAGNEAGQQSVFAAKGATNADTVYTYDGVVITDSACGGCSSMYYDFDAFDQIKVDTGGNDLSVMTGGVGLNFITKRGTNAFHGSIRSYFSHDDLQSNNVPDSLKTDPRIAVDGNPDRKADRIAQIADSGIDLGGPLVKDKLWFWASYNKNDIRLIRISQTQDKTLLKNYNAKINWQASKNDMVSASWFYGKKEKFGRSPGYAGNEPDSILFDQGDFGPDFGPFSGLKGLFKIEDNHVFGPNFFMNAKYAYFGWGYGFDPRGGIEQSGGIDYTADKAYGSSLRYRSLRPWHVADLNASYFVAGMGGNHELRFGFGYRSNPVHSSTRYAGNGSVAKKNSDTGDEDTVLLYRDRVAFFKGTNLDVYAGDTFTKGRMALNLGVRYDQQKASNEASTAPAQRLIPDLFPAVTIDPGQLQDITWNNISPRVGITLALDEKRKTVVRASYAQYAGQLNSFETTSNNAAGVYYPYLAYAWVDRNGDHLASRDEVLTNGGILYSNGVDPNNPGSSTPVNQIDPNYKGNKDNEVIVGIERELAANFAVGAAYSWRRSTDIPSWNPRIGLTSADYTANAPVTVSSPEGTFTAQAFAPDDSKVTGGSRLQNRPDYHRSYSGIELSATKRLANKWMMRAAFSYMDWTEHFDGPNAIVSPTRTQDTVGGTLAGPSVEGGQVIIKSYGSKTDTFFNSKWQFSGNALYQLPAGFEMAAAVLGRQGYPFVVVMRLPAGADGRPRALATPEVDSLRFDDLWNVDFRLGKTLKLGSRLSLKISADVFNAFNNDIVLQRARQVNAGNNGGLNGSFNTVNELINPRVARIGVRLQF